jgi:hypothetical protein
MRVAVAMLVVSWVGAARAEPRDARRFIPPNTPGQAGQVELRLDVDPPALIGPGVTLVVDKGVLSGELQGHQVDVAISGTHAEGNGPGGKVALDWVSDSDGGLLLTGVWNNHKVHLRFSSDGITGRLMQSDTPTGRGEKSCRFDVNQVAKGGTLNGLAQCLGYSEPVRYYVQPAATAELNNPAIALLLTAFFESPTSFVVR